ncbi:hypothetical protein QF026_001483 [Streptomyces aurantiacus]|uniref:hypothetical protein n=1 Tax=Streptomyces aurantiacus TaxID=47760 RepID=UPI0027946656|nr:hypothetical protein [Streptomyces aurantiacus]MDQ0773017.1 hypothetical protein [Streptomyces aurantiacus]
MIIGLRRGIDSPINRSYAYSPDLTVHRPLIGYVSAVHSIDYWVASLLIRPMLADLADTGSWRRDTAKRYVVQDGLCHSFFLDRTLRHVSFYLADHSQYNCFLTPSPPPRADQNTWFCPPDDPVPPPEGSHSAWRYLLRTAVAVPMRLSHAAFLSFARLDSDSDPALGSGLGPPDTFLSTFQALAEQARIVHTRLPEGPGTFNFTVGTQLWTVCREDALNRSKPQVHSIQHLRDPTTPPQPGNPVPVTLLGAPDAGQGKTAGGEIVVGSSF